VAGAMGCYPTKNFTKPTAGNRLEQLTVSIPRFGELRLTNLLLISLAI
jgi:hypothetical protein